MAENQYKTDKLHVDYNCARLDNRLIQEISRNNVSIALNNKTVRVLNAPGFKNYE
jgi:hypothetical protein